MTPNKDLLTAISDANNDEPGLELSQKSSTKNPKRRAVKKSHSDRRYTKKPPPKRQFMLVEHWFFEAHEIYHQARAV